MVTGYGPNDKGPPPDDDGPLAGIGMEFKGQVKFVQLK